MISVLMSVYNETTELLDESITSIKNQSYPNWELIIINDNPDNKQLSRFLEKIAESDNRIKVMTNEYNSGLVNSLNTAIGGANGEYIARMDADDIAILDRFEKQIGFLKTHNLDFVFSNVQSIDESGLILKEKVLPNKDLIDMNKIKKIMSFTDLAFHPTWLMKKNVMIDLHGYRMINSAEDYDFVIRAIRGGLKLGYQGEVLLKYRYRLNSISRNNSLRQEKINLIIQKGLTIKKGWDEWSMKRVDALQINSQEETKLSMILQAGVNFKNSRKLIDGFDLIWKILLYPKGINSVFKNLMIEKRIQKIFFE